MTRKATPKALSETSSGSGNAAEDSSSPAGASPIAAPPTPAATSETTGERWIAEAIDAHQASLMIYVARIVGDMELARDVVQDAFLRLLQQDRATIESHLVEWLYTVCRNRALDVKRKNSRVRSLADETAGDIANQGRDPAATMEHAETVSRMLLLLEHLPKNQQEVIRLKFQAGLSYREISSVTRLSVSNVGFLLHTGLKTLRERMNREP